MVSLTIIYPREVFRFSLLSAVTVLKSRSIRIAVNVCVIGALLLLPSSGYRTTSAADCDAAVSGTATCQGCGNCSVSKSGESCGCCCRKPTTRPAKVKPSESKGCCKHSSSSPAQSEEASSEHLGVCLCGQQQQPKAPAPQNRSGPERLIQVLMNAPAVDDLPVDNMTRGSLVEQVAGPPFLLPHDSQRRLCIWLI